MFLLQSIKTENVLAVLDEVLMSCWPGEDLIEEACWRW